MAPPVDTLCVEWATSRTVARGQAECGDEFCVRSLRRRVLISVLDGLGHGPEAFGVARQAVRLLEDATTPDVLDLVRQCHQGLRGTRGVVMSLALFDERESTMSWVGVGNVSGALWGAGSLPPRTLLLRRGLVGCTLPPLQLSVVPVTPGDMVVFTTDGVSGEIDRRMLRAPSLQAIADRILARHATGVDDALALVARYRRSPG